jgi:hypothetical protein
VRLYGKISPAHRFCGAPTHPASRSTTDEEWAGCCSELIGAKDLVLVGEHSHCLSQSVAVQEWQAFFSSWFQKHTDP